MTWTCLLAWIVYYAPFILGGLFLLVVIGGGVAGASYEFGWSILWRLPAFLMMLCLGGLLMGGGFIAIFSLHDWARRIVTTCPEPQ